MVDAYDATDSKAHRSLVRRWLIISAATIPYRTVGGLNLSLVPALLDMSNEMTPKEALDALALGVVELACAMILLGMGWRRRETAHACARILSTLAASTAVAGYALRIPLTYSGRASLWEWGPDFLLVCIAVASYCMARPVRTQ